MERMFAGVDPGIVHTGVVVAWVDVDRKTWRPAYTVVNGLDADKVNRTLGPTVEKVWVEDFRPRGHFRQDSDMTVGVREIAKEIGPKAKVLPNTGVKKVVKPALMRLLKVDSFSQSTHHDDLRSAARIMLLGMFKDPELNGIIASIVEDHVDGRGVWDVRV